MPGLLESVAKMTFNSLSGHISIGGVVNTICRCFQFVTLDPKQMFIFLLNFRQRYGR